MGRRGYPAEFRRHVLDLVAGGRRVSDIAHDLGISDQPVYDWRRQERIDRGTEAGPSFGAQRDRGGGNSRPLNRVCLPPADLQRIAVALVAQLSHRRSY